MIKKNKESKDLLNELLDITHFAFCCNIALSVQEEKKIRKIIIQYGLVKYNFFDH